MILQDNHTFIGMNTDNSPTNQDPRFLRDAYNIRFTDSKNGAFLSLSNECGNAFMKLKEENINSTNDSLVGSYVGHCIIGKYLVIFTHCTEENVAANPILCKYKDNIWAIYKGENLDKETYGLFHIYGGNNLNLDANYPIQTLGVIEGNNVYKVYWVDGVNPPRVINILQKELKLAANLLKEDELPEYDTVEYYKTIYGEDTNYLFDFIPEVSLNEKVSVTKTDTGGMFSSGTIQYAFTYYNKYGSETNIVYTTGLYYIAFHNKGGSGKDIIPCSFVITVNNIETSFDYLRIYSIHRTSQDAVPTVKILTDIELKNNITSTTYIDTGTTGSILDPTKLLYIGGEDIIAGSIAAKDNTLFLGNITINRPAIPKDIKNSIKEYCTTHVNSLNINDYGIISEIKNTILKNYDKDSFYPYDSQLNYDNPSTFMPEETYRFGLQFQYKNGRWSEPVFYTDYTISSGNRPKMFSKDNIEQLQKLIYKLQLPEEIRTKIYSLGYRKMRGLIVSPTVSDMKILAYGVVNPTVFSSYNRENKSPFSQSSWFFRPIGKNIETDTNSKDVLNGAIIPFRHLESLLGGFNRGCEIQNNIANPIESTTKLIKNKQEVNTYYVDQSIVTFHSPDIEFNNSIRQYIGKNKIKFDIVGITPFKNSAGDISIQTSTPAISASDSGEKHFTTYSTDYSNRGLYAGLFYNSHASDDDRDKITIFNRDDGNYRFNWMVFPWHRNGSLINDCAREDGTKYADLKKKVLANIKVSIDNEWFDKAFNMDITKMEIFDDDQVSLTKIDSPENSLLDPINYYGNIDTLNIYKSISVENGLPSGYDFYIAPSLGVSASSIFGKDIWGKPIVPGSVVTNEFTTNYIYPLSNLSQIGDKIKLLRKTFDAVRMKYKSSKHGVFAFNYYKVSDSVYVPTVLPSISNYNSALTIKTIPFWEKRTTFIEPNGSQAPSDDKNTYIPIQYAMLLDDTMTTKPVESDILKELKDHVLNPKLGDLALTIDISEDTYNSLDKAAIYTYTEQGWKLATLDGSSLETNTIFYVASVGSGTQFPVVVSDTYDSEGFWQKYSIDKGKVKRAQPKAGEGDNTHDVVIDNVVKYHVHQDNIPLGNINETTLNSFLYLGKIYRDDADIQNRFGGNTPEALRNNLWIPAGKPTNIIASDNADDSYILFENGDTYYMRYDCLKTQPFTEEDQNGVVDIASFMCLTRVNLDGRYDDNRGLLSNLNIRNTNFNLMNDIYNQKDNFFNYRILDDYYYGANIFPSQFIWSMQKNNLEEIDTWTNLTLANSYDIYNNCGKISAITLFKDNLYIFQDSGFSQLLFNNRVQIPVSDGVPVEISNSNKVTGVRDISTSIGCTDFKLITQSPSTLYFIDDSKNNLYAYAETLKDLSTTLFNNKWFNGHSYDKEDPYYYLGYDTIYKDVYALTKKESIAYSEILSQFTSRYAYKYIVDNFFDDFISLAPVFDKNNNKSIFVGVWKNRYRYGSYINRGLYNSFYFTNKSSNKDAHGFNPYFTYICNDNGQVSKVFDSIEFTVDCCRMEIPFGEKPFEPNYILEPLEYPSSVQVKTSYQDSGKCVFITDRHNTSKDITSLRKRFNIWRGLIPRQQNTRNRMRDVWAEITINFNEKPYEVFDTYKPYRFVFNSIKTKYNV